MAAESLACSALFILRDLIVLLGIYFADTFCIGFMMPRASINGPWVDVCNVAMLMAFCACWRTMKVFKAFKANDVKVDTI